MNNLKEREKNILEFMKNYLSENGYPPTVREICTGLSIKSTSTVHKDIANLVKLGVITKDHTKSRALIVENVQPEEPIPSSIVNIPVIGRVAAGTPILADENVEDSIPVPSRFISNGNNFLLVVKGESMIDVGIMDGDYILAQQQNTANNGDIVVAMIEGDFEAEATVKTYYQENDHIRLQPENPSMEPILTRDVQILGKVKGVFRYFS